MAVACLALHGGIRRHEMVADQETRNVHGDAELLERAWYRRPLLFDVNEYLHDRTDGRHDDE